MDEDTFPADGPIQTTNLANIASIPRGPAGPGSEAPSVATTALASAVGSYVGDARDAFLRSFTFADGEPGLDWNLTLSDPPVAVKRRKKSSLLIDEVGGSVGLSRIQTGDQLVSINGKKIGPSYNAEAAMRYMDQCLKEQGLLSVAVGNPVGEDILIQATVLKPKPEMTYEEMGVTVWFWAGLCIKSIDSKSLFKQSVLKSSDEIISVNDISCDRVTPEQFAHIINNLPLEITIIVKRGKQRWTGKFG